MMVRNLLFSTFIFTIFSMDALAQTGIIRGKVIEDATGEELYGVTVMVKNTSKGVITDFEGSFDLKIEPGTYDLQVSFVSFETMTITGITVNADDVTLLGSIRLKEAIAELEAVTVTAEVIRNSESALLTVKRKSANLMDGISSASFERTGDSDAADAVKRVTGVSVEGGKYVYVRGLGDRYTKTTLNSTDIPGLDPDRNSLQIDIFPTNLIDNMVIMKSAVAELPADFTGGIVNIETKDFPETKILDISAGIGYNPAMHLNKDYITHEGSQTDFLGFDDGTRALPDGARDEMIPSPIHGSKDREVRSFLRDFNPTLGATRQTSPVNYNLGISYGNQFSVFGDRKLGLIFSATYKNTTRYYDDVVYGEYQRLIDPSVYELRYATTQEGVLGESDVLLGGILGLAYKMSNTKIKLMAMHLQNGQSRSGQFFIDNDGAAVGQSGYLAFSNNLEYNQRGLTNMMLNGEHHINDANLKISWKISPTISSLNDPDIRRTAFTTGDVDTTFSAGAGGNPNRIWRNLDEINIANRLDIDKGYQFLGYDSKLKFGVSYTYKVRDYEILTYDMQFLGGQPEWGFDPNNVLTEDHIYPEGPVYFSSGNPVPNSNAYNSSVNNSAGYIANELVLNRFKAIVGLRAEKYVQRHTGRDAIYAGGDTEAGNNLDNEKVLDALDFFPSGNFIFSATENQNIRLSYSKTIARPSFKELSFAQILDPITNRIFNGGLFEYSDWEGRLVETRINNLDLRWEWFIKRSELVSFSLFYKTFDKPIELVRIQEQQTSTEYQPRNVGDGKLYGMEIEFRKNLGFISPLFRNLSMNGNFTFVESVIEMTDREFNSRSQYQKEDQIIDNKREMAGQSPYIINGGLAYEDADKGFDAGFFYNVKGPTLFMVGAGLFPDVYAQPFHSLNFTLNKSLGEEKRTQINFKATNLLNDLREEMYTGFRTENQYFSKFNPGIEMSFGFKHSF